MEHDLRYVTSRLEDERVSPRDGRLDRPEDPVVHLDVLSDLGELAHHQGEVVLVGQLTELANPIQGVLVPQPCPERVTRVGRVGDQATVAQDVDDLVEGTLLRVLRVYREVLGHLAIVSPQRTPLAVSEPSTCTFRAPDHGPPARR